MEITKRGNAALLSDNVDLVALPAVVLNAGARSDEPPHHHGIDRCLERLHLRRCDVSGRPKTYERVVAQIMWGASDG